MISFIENISKFLFKKDKEKTINKVKELSESSDNGIRFSIDKETGLLRWIAAWSSNYEDDDFPADIISEQSHKSFIDKVEKGEVQYPELWHWHVKGTKWGSTDWLAYDDDSGIVWASGLVDKGKEHHALGLLKSKSEIGVSHGMKDVMRDPFEKNVISEYVTYEISDLPLRWAANKMTTFFIAESQNDMEVEKMDEKKIQYLKDAGVSDKEIDGLEAFGKEQADKFANRARKETSEIEAEVETEEIKSGKEPKTAEEESETAKDTPGEETQEAETDSEEVEAETDVVAEKTPVEDEVVESEDAETKEFAVTVKEILQSSFKEFGDEIAKGLAVIDERLKVLENTEKERLDVEKKERELEPLSKSLYEVLSAIGSESTEVKSTDDVEGPAQTEKEKTNGDVFNQYPNIAGFLQSVMTEKE